MNQQEKQAFDQMREALEQAHDMVDHWGLYASEYFQKKHDLAGDLSKIKAALDAANAMQPQAQEPKLPEYFAQYEYAPDFSVVVSVYRRHADAVPELIHSEALPKQIGDCPQAIEPAWRPIESAPKDGTKFLAWWGPEVGKPVITYWLDNSNTRTPWAGWRVPSMQVLSVHSKATLWMPLPPPETK